MPVIAESRYITKSVVLTKRQDASIEAVRHDMARKLGGRVSFAEAVREVVTAGITSLSQVSDSPNRTSPESERAA